MVKFGLTRGNGRGMSVKGNERRSKDVKLCGSNVRKRGQPEESV